MKRLLSVILIFLLLTWPIAACRHDPTGMSEPESEVMTSSAVPTPDVTRAERVSTSESRTMSEETTTSGTVMTSETESDVEDVTTTSEVTDTSEPMATVTEPVPTDVSDVTTSRPETEPADETVSEPTSEPTTAPDDTTSTSEHKSVEAPDELLIADRPDLYLAVSDMRPTGDGGYAVELHTENRSDDTNYMIMVTQASVNALVGPVQFMVMLGAGETTRDPIIFEAPRFLERIDHVRDIEIDLVIAGDRDPEVPVFDAGFHVYPEGREAATTYTYEPHPEDRVLVENETVRMVLTDVFWDDTEGFTLELYTENLSDTCILLTQADACLNDEMIDPIYIERLPLGKKAYSLMSWYPYDLELMGLDLESIHEIRFTLHGEICTEDGSGDAIFEEPVYIER